MSEVSRRPLTVDGGRPLYVEPVAFEASGSDVLMAGAPSYLFAADTAADGSRPWELNTVFGVVIQDDGGARLVPPPIDSRLLGTVRAVARSPGTWSVVFVERTEPAKDISDRQRVARLWFGVFDGARWSRLQALPLPAEGVLDVGRPSRLVSHGDTLGFAVRLQGEHAYSDVAFYRFDGERWSYEVVPTRRAAYAEPAYVPERGWVMAVVMPDTTLSSDGNSLFLYERAPEWRLLRKVAPGRPEPVYEPVMRADVLGWWAVVTDPSGEERAEARLMADPLDPDSRGVTVDSDVAEFRLVRAGPEGRLWMSDRPGTPAWSIRLFAEAEGEVQEIGQLASPYDARSSTVSLPPADVLLTGGVVDRERQTLASLMIRARIACGSPVP